MKLITAENPLGPNLKLPMEALTELDTTSTQKHVQRHIRAILGERLRQVDEEILNVGMQMDFAMHIHQPCQRRINQQCQR